MTPEQFTELIATLNSIKFVILCFQLTVLALLLALLWGKK